MTAAIVDRPPVTLITGYLGSGKTTLLNRLLAGPDMARAAVIINEFGAIGLDHLLVATPAENTVLLANGCICCTVRGDLVDTLRDLGGRRRDGSLPSFDRVLIETTGLADPVPLLQTLIADEVVARLYRLDGVVTLVDAVHGAGTLDEHAEAVKQAALADRMLIAKCDLAGEKTIAALEGRLARINPGARRLRMVCGDIAPREIFGAALGGADAAGRVARWLDYEAYAAADTGPGQDHHHPGGSIRAHSFRIDRPVTRAGLMTWLTLLASMRGASLLRVKGLLNVEGAPFAVHAVQTVIDEPVELPRWPDGERRSRLVFITRGLAREDIKRTLAALEVDAGRRSPRGTLDPQAYARFVAAAQGFR
ncbi:MAG TPA: GTP-binding protein [Burkholderiales bacterium]|nr:GTP-binding protein [Burkholderiales bacterium]